jgi:hypothetical protein
MSDKNKAPVMSKETYDTLLATVRSELWNDQAQYALLKNNLATKCRSFEERCAYLVSVANQGFKPCVMARYQMVALHAAVSEAVQSGKPDMQLLASILQDVENYREWRKEQDQPTSKVAN